MTAPAIAQAPAAPSGVVAPVEQTAPAVVQTPAAPAEEASGFDSILDRIAKKMSPEAAAHLQAEDAAFAAEQGGTVEGAIEAAITGPADGTPAVATPVVPTAQNEFVADDGDGEVVLRARKADGTFTPMDGTQLYELALKDKATGEMRVYTKTLPELMRMAKDGVAMQKSRAELEYYRSKVPEWTKGHEMTQAQINTIRQDAEGYKALAISLLTEPEPNVVARREAYAQQFTPEAQAQRLAAENARLRAQVNGTLTAPPQTPIVQQQQSPIGPAVQALASRIGQTIAQVEGMVGKEAATGKLVHGMQSLYVDGRIPPEKFGELEQYVNGPFKDWATSEAAKRTTESQAAAKALEEARQIQARAQLAARQTGTATRPGPANTSGSQRAPEKPARSLQEMTERIIHKPRAQTA